jgi:hypothetical protein|tara:strand:+ start:3073 stop:3372 length:300 start_codon:yes stop_codon:yes gene_type:complete
MNARKEFPQGVGISCASITITQEWEVGDSIKLPIGHTKEEYEEFLNKLDVEYDAGYGSQVLHGYIWCNDGTWFSRGEYDGSEWWQYHSLPTIPDYLKKL